MNDIKLDGQSKDVVSENISKLREIFPSVIADGQIDFEMLKSILGEDIDDAHEKYAFTWPGKTQAIRESQKQSTGTLRPCREESKDWDTTQNLYIEGDNLEVLKLLQKGYYNKIKAIYIDPPYNTGKDFIYSDNYQDNLENYLKISGQLKESKGERESTGVKLTTNPETAGRYHSNWLNMMYPRIKLARNLLMEDGFLLVSISDIELENLKRILYEIFGEMNYICQFIWQSKSGGAHDEQFIVTETEYILLFAKNRNKLKLSKKVIHDESYKLYDEYVEERGKYKLNKLDRRMTSSHYTESLNYPINLQDGDLIFPGGKNVRSDEGWNWRWSKDKVSWGLSNGFIEIKKNKNNWAVYTKQYEKVDNNNQPIERTLPYRNLIYSTDFSTTQASNEITKFFGFKIFEYAKPSKLIEFLFEIGNIDEDIVLDFFSGSGTTAHGIFELNNKFNKNNKFIMVQIPELVETNSKSYSEGYKNICEIGKERIRLAGDKILEESNNKDLDIGFKVFKLDSSNLEKWDPDYNNIQESLIIDNIKEDRINEDLIYEIMLKYGIDLTLPIEEHDNIYSIGFGALIICLDSNITKEIANDVIKLTKNSSTSRVVFKDSGFKSDADKINIKEILKTNNVDEFITI